MKKIIDHIVGTILYINYYFFFILFRSILKLFLMTNSFIQSLKVQSAIFSNPKKTIPVLQVRKRKIKHLIKK